MSEEKLEVENEDRNPKSLEEIEQQISEFENKIKEKFAKSLTVREKELFLNLQFYELHEEPYKRGFKQEKEMLFWKYCIKFLEDVLRDREEIEKKEKQHHHSDVIEAFFKLISSNLEDVRSRLEREERHSKGRYPFSDYQRERIKSLYLETE